MKCQSLPVISFLRARPRWLAAVLLAGTLPVRATEVSFPITQDSYLDSRGAAQQSNFGLNGSVRVLVNSDTSVTRGLFALPAAVAAYPPTAIQQAKVYFYVFQDNTRDRDIRLYPLTTSFVEGTGGSGATATGATWLTRDGTNQWTTPGGDFDADHYVVAVKEPVLDPDLNDRFFSWDITGLLTHALTRSNLLNYGAVLIMDGENRPPASGSDRAPFTSSESASNPPEYRPRVSLTLRGPVLNLVRSSPTAFRLDIIHATPSLPHRIERSFDLASPTNWAEVVTLLVTGTETNWMEAVFGAGTNVFYRVVVMP
ncbi:MAG: hypothetical protein IPM17_18925 [Verrucomicrobia bacterium]|nr:hypothetical protein [Verrucomicrobiota bacterium]